ncbi:hypothetical protein [Catalinimonas alkaloidigena]|uniref:hypothetical protein n=1 Tax=Catalinimonas alkaloidigena TaxID=1075417 RepID=UPI002406ECC0|nr:hypothetical protein [Catalinimonas alkaloidigena]
MSGARAEHSGLAKLKEQLRAGDTFGGLEIGLIRHGMMGRTLQNLIEWVTWLESEGIAFKTLQESIDTRGRPDYVRRETHLSGNA